jgi:tetracycline 7-halogenase / FADH2 O2-dependent halogenase
MRTLHADIVVIGSGFGGSLTAMIARRIGLDTVLIERARHPRFTIGESSTPLADLALRQMADRYDLPRIRLLTEYGSWRRSYPDIMRGLKRGFSYFHHVAEKTFAPRDDHANDLLVAANPDDEHADTHWLRADVDQFFAKEAVAAGVAYFDQTEIAALAEGEPWHLTLNQDNEEIRIQTPFLVDGSGEGGVVASSLGLEDNRERLQTNSRTIYGHFTGVRRWRDIYEELGGKSADHPYDCDAAALHHIFDGGWMWVLRFDNDVVSAGFVLDRWRYPIEGSRDAAAEWLSWLSRFPSIRAQFADATPIRPIVRTGRLQRVWSCGAGRNWAMLPYTLGFLDPLHSSGIAHNLSGVERLMAILQDGRNVTEGLAQYDRTLHAEFEMMDRIVHGCYAGFSRFELMTTYAMHYFGGAIASEHRRRDDRHDVHDGFLMAHDDTFRQTIAEHHGRVRELAAREPSDPGDAARFLSDVAASIPEGNPAGLCDPAKRNMYEYA